MEEKEEKKELTNEEAVKQGTQIAWLSYLGLLVIVPILVAPDNDYVKFHIRQGIAILIFEAGWIFLDIVLSFIPVIKYLAGILNFFAWIGFLVISIMGIINAVQGEWKKLPVVGDLGEQLKII